LNRAFGTIPYRELCFAALNSFFVAASPR